MRPRARRLAQPRRRLPAPRFRACRTPASPRLSETVAELRSLRGGEPRLRIRSDRPRVRCNAGWSNWRPAPRPPCLSRGHPRAHPSPQAASAGGTSSSSPAWNRRTSRERTLPGARLARMRASPALLADLARRPCHHQPTNGSAGRRFPGQPGLSAAMCAAFGHECMPIAGRNGESHAPIDINSLQQRSRNDLDRSPPQPSLDRPMNSRNRPGTAFCQCPPRPFCQQSPLLGAKHPFLALSDARFRGSTRGGPGADRPDTGSAGMAGTTVPPGFPALPPVLARRGKAAAPKGAQQFSAIRCCGGGRSFRGFGGALG